MCYVLAGSIITVTLNTIHIVDQANDIVFCLCRLFAGTSTNVVSAQKTFGNEMCTLLDIIRVINDYNHSMNAIILAD